VKQSWLFNFGHFRNFDSLYSLQPEVSTSVAQPGKTLSLLSTSVARDRRWRFLVGIFLGILFCSPSYGQVAPGYTLHFNFLNSPAASAETVVLAEKASARVVSLVPPAHVWEDGNGLRSLDAAITAVKQQGLHFVLSRMDANQSTGLAWLYENPLAHPGRLPDGSAAIEWFRATVGNHRYEQWQNQETRYYSKRYGRLPQLVGTALGGMVEPFVSQRGSLLQWDDTSDSYEIVQYTSDCLAEWHRWLRRHFGGVQAVNRAYHTRFLNLAMVPMPLHGEDSRFGRPREAYFDFVQTINDWFVRQYQTNRNLWHQFSTKPFLLQLSGFESEKIARGRPEFAALDIPSWIAQADAVGVSLYAHAGYPGWGHGANVATLQLLAAARDGGKQAFVMESGCEAPRVTLRAHELSFVTHIGLLLNPTCYVYEYFRYERSRRVDPGMMVSPSGSTHQPGFDRVAEQLRSLAASAKTITSPCFFYLSAPRTARSNEVAGRVNRAVYHLASYIPCRLLPWQRFDRIPTGSVVLIPPGLHKVASTQQLKQLLNSAKLRGWHLVSDNPTGLALLRLSPLCTFQPLALGRLLARECVDEEASILLEELAGVAAFQERFAQQPVEPRPGVSWVQAGADLSVWVDDRKPLVCHWDTLRHHGIERLWCSSRGGEPIELVLKRPSGGQLNQALPCREWVQLKDLNPIEVVMAYPSR
jgi:hypothetical protein